MWHFTKTYHAVRVKFGLTDAEYSVIDTIAQMAVNRDGCEHSDSYIAIALAKSRATVFRASKKGVLCGLIIERHAHGLAPNRRGSKKWHDAIADAEQQIKTNNPENGKTPKLGTVNTTEKKEYLGLMLTDGEIDKLKHLQDADLQDMARWVAAQETTNIAKGGQPYASHYAQLIGWAADKLKTERLRQKTKNIIAPKPAANGQTTAAANGWNKPKKT